MNQEHIERLWKNEALKEYINSQARRHFANREDQEDASDQAWEEIVKLSDRSTSAMVWHRAYRAIKNLYDREKRSHANIKHKKLFPGANG